MKITFEGDIHDIIAQMEKVFALLAVRAIVKEGGATHNKPATDLLPATQAAPLQAPGPQVGHNQS